jgi:hypothetical protein
MEDMYESADIRHGSVCAGRKSKQAFALSLL